MGDYPGSCRCNIILSLYFRDKDGPKRGKGQSTIAKGGVGSSTTWILKA